MTGLQIVGGIVALPLVAAVLSLSGWFSLRALDAFAKVSAVGVLVLWGLAYRFLHSVGVLTGGFVRVDALSLWFILALSLVYLMIASVSKVFLKREAPYFSNTPRYEHNYYALIHFFVAIMLAVCGVDNIGLMWVGIEATTLISALLVAFRFTPNSIEAAWKYVMVCTVGICFALLGTIILYYVQMGSGLYVLPSDALNWYWLLDNAVFLDKGLIKYAFLFVFVGYGTKLGLAPMHTWLPDTYSQAPSTISGLLSGGLSTCVMFVLIKNLIIVRQCLSSEFIANLLLFFGVLSIAVALPFMLVQREIKRLFAYSSVENIGLLMIALAVNSEQAYLGLLIFVLNHALIKFVLFYVAGRILYDFGSDKMMRIHGLLVSTPRLARILLFAALAIAGMPPFGIFYGKLYILQSVFAAGHRVLGIVVLLLLVAIFLGFFYHIIRMLSDRSSHHIEGFTGFDSWVLMFAMGCSVLTALLFTEAGGVLLHSAVKILSGVS